MSTKPLFYFNLKIESKVKCQFCGHKKGDINDI